MTPVLPLQFVPVAPAAVADQLRDRLVDRRLRQDFSGDESAAREAAASLIAAALDTLEPNDVVTADGRVAGRVWLMSREDELNVVDLVLDESVATADRGDLRAVVAAVEQWVESVARRRGAVRLTVPVPAADPVVAALLTGGGYQLASTNMRLDLTTTSSPAASGSDTTSGADAAAAGPAVVFEPMPEADWPAWKQWQVDGYAEARHLAGESLETARRVAAVQIDELLPDGLATAGNSVFVVRESGSQTADQPRVGTLWLSTERPMAYVYDIEIEPDQRRRGFGAATMRAAADWARERGHPAIGLNVFGYNTGARALYESLGYQVIEEFYGRELDG